MDAALLFLSVAFVSFGVVITLVLARNAHDNDTPVTCVTVTTDGPIQPEDLQAIGMLLSAHCEDPEAVYQAILEQVARDEAAAGLDTALDQIRREGGAA